MYIYASIVRIWCGNINFRINSLITSVLFLERTTHMRQWNARSGTFLTQHTP